MKPDLFKNYDFKRMFEEIKKKYKKYGKITGKFKIENLKKTEVLAFEEIGEYFKEGETIIYTAKKLQDFLDRSIYAKENLEEILFWYYKSEIRINSEKRKSDKEDKDDFFYKILINFKGTDVYYYYEDIFFNQKSIYKTITLRYNEDKERLKKELIITGNALNNLPYLNNKIQSLQMFSELVSGDPHYFDENGRHFIILYEGIKYKFGISTNSNGIIEKNKILYQGALIKEGITNNITIYGFRGFKKDGSESAILKAGNEEEEYLIISLDNMKALEKIEAVSESVYILENPSVFSYIFEYLKKRKEKIPALVCSSGQLNFSAYKFLNKLEKKNIDIYYSGDIDPEGIQIACNLRNNFKEIKLLAYTKENYINNLSGKLLSEQRLKKLNSISDEKLLELIDLIKEKNQASYQESFVEEILLKIMGNNHKKVMKSL